MYKNTYYLVEELITLIKNKSQWRTCDLGYFAVNLTLDQPYWKPGGYLNMFYIHKVYANALFIYSLSFSNKELPICTGGLKTLSCRRRIYLGSIGCYTLFKFTRMSTRSLCTVKLGTYSASDRQTQRQPIKESSLQKVLFVAEPSKRTHVISLGVLNTHHLAWEWGWLFKWTWLF